MIPKENLLEVIDLTTKFKTDEGTIQILDNISFNICHGEVLGMVGESGSGKSVTALSIMKLLPKFTSQISAKKILFNDHDLIKYSDSRMREVRGKEIAMIFQDPMTSLDPVYSLGFQITESILNHSGMDKSAALDMAIDLLRQVGIPSAEKRINDYPHQLSGGMRQRVMIAMGLACNPKLLIADEPTTALDVTIQAQILDILRRLRSERQMAIWLITHDLGVIAEMCDRVVVMYGGRIAEVADVKTIFKNPAHPYTKGLLASIPRLDEDINHLTVIEGTVPNMKNPPTGCRFHPRCEKALKICSVEKPQMVHLGTGHTVSCHLYEGK